MKSPSKQSGSPKRSKSTSFEEYVKEHGEEEAVPFDDVLRKLMKSSKGEKPGKLTGTKEKSARSDMERS